MRFFSLQNKVKLREINNKSSWGEKILSAKIYLFSLVLLPHSIELVKIQKCLGYESIKLCLWHGNVREAWNSNNQNTVNISPACREKWYGRLRMNKNQWRSDRLQIIRPYSAISVRNSHLSTQKKKHLNQNFFDVQWLKKLNRLERSVRWFFWWKGMQT